MAYFPFLRKLPFPRVLKISASQKSIVELTAKLVRAQNVNVNIDKDILSLMNVENQKPRGELACSIKLRPSLRSFG